jgi:uncharacterized membrane protein
MQCPVCHSEVAAQNTFCSNCGASLSGAPPVGAAAPPPIATAIPSAASSSGLSDNAAAAIAYLTIIPAILFLILEPYNRIPLVRFHSFQCIGLCIAAFVLQIAIVIGEATLHFIPLSWIIFSVVHAIIALGLFIAWLIAIIKASRGEWYKLPLIGDFAEKQARS